MKATTFLVLIVTALGACDREASPAADGASITAATAAGSPISPGRARPRLFSGKAEANTAQFSGAGVAGAVTDAVSPESPPAGADPLRQRNGGAQLLQREILFACPSRDHGELLLTGFAAATGGNPIIPSAARPSD